MENPYANLQPVDIGGAFNNAFMQGQQAAQQRNSQNALAKFATNPDDPAAMSEIAKFKPELAIQLRQQQQQQHMQTLEQHRDNILKGAQIIRQFGVKDQRSWDAAKQAAGQLGIDLSEVPAQYDPHYIQGLVSIADAFEPQKQQQDRFIPLQPGGSLAQVGPDGVPHVVVMPNDGSHQIGTPAMAGGPQPGAIEDGYRFRGGNPADPNSWEPVSGGPTPQASGGFR